MPFAPVFLSFIGLICIQYGRSIRIDWLFTRPTGQSIAIQCRCFDNSERAVHACEWRSARPATLQTVNRRSCLRVPRSTREESHRKDSFLPFSSPLGRASHPPSAHRNPLGNSSLRSCSEAKNLPFSSRVKATWINRLRILPSKISPFGPKRK